MKLKEAMKLIQADINDKDVEWDSPLGRAYKLSFEALKYHQKHNLSWHNMVFFPLPGETK